MFQVDAFNILSVILFCGVLRENGERGKICQINFIGLKKTSCNAERLIWSEGDEKEIISLY